LLLQQASADQRNSRNETSYEGENQRIEIAEKAYIDKASFIEIKKMTYDLAEEIGDENASPRTVIADASIVCYELFQVKDAQSGTVIQGMEDEQEDKEVVHNIRFEVVIQAGLLAKTATYQATKQGRILPD
jgi:hypothetical protein